MADESRFLYTVFWGGGVVLLSIVTVVTRALLLVRQRDGRSFREFLQGVGFGLVGLASAAAIVVVIVKPDALDLRSFLVSVALGAFAGAMFIMTIDAVGQLRRKR